jgi:hypothetical protein
MSASVLNIVIQKQLSARYYGYPAVTRLIVDADPAAAAVKNKEGCTPFGVLVKKAVKPAVQEEQRLAQAVQTKDAVRRRSAAFPVPRHIDVKKFESAKPRHTCSRDFKTEQDVNVEDAAHLAHCFPEIIDMLVEANPAELEGKDEDGNTALHRAALSGWSVLVQRILAFHPTMASVLNGCGQTPLYVACFEGYAPVAALLLDADPSVASLQDEVGCTALHRAAAYVRVRLYAVVVYWFPSVCVRVHVI